MRSKDYKNRWWLGPPRKRDLPENRTDTQNPQNLWRHRRGRDQHREGKWTHIPIPPQKLSPVDNHCRWSLSSPQWSVPGYTKGSHRARRARRAQQYMVNTKQTQWWFGKGFCFVSLCFVWAFFFFFFNLAGFFCLYIMVSSFVFLWDVCVCECVSRRFYAFLCSLALFLILCLFHPIMVCFILLL